MTYFGTAVDEDSADAFSASIEAETFEDAFAELRRRAMLRFPDRCWRPTCLVEEPTRGPLALVLDLTTGRITR